MTGGPGARSAEPDVLRGFALAGILPVNALLMADPGALNGTHAGLPFPDRAAAWATMALFSTKFYLIFAFVLGYSFGLRQQALGRAGLPSAPSHLRRTLALLVLGTLHAVLLFPGDILVPYALLGLALYALRDAPDARLLRSAAVLTVAGAALTAAVGLYHALLTSPVAPSGPADGPLRRFDLGAAVASNLGDLAGTGLPGLLYLAGLLAASLAGLAAARTGLLADRRHRFARLRRLALRGLPVGLAGGVLMAVCAAGPQAGRWFFMGRAAGFLTAPCLALAYAWAVLAFTRTARGGRAGRLLAAAGRMSLTHYLTQSLVLALVFSPVGLGLRERTGPAAVLAGCALLYGCQLAVARALRDRVRRGPAEHVLRAVTGPAV